MIISPNHHRWLYLLGLALIALGLPLSKAFMSIGGIILAGNFLLEGDYFKRWQKLISSPLVLLFIAVFLIHIVGLFWTNDFDHAFKDIRVKLPLLFLPLIIFLSKPLNRKEFALITGLFAASVVLTSFLSTFTYFQMQGDPSADFRSISLFTSHIRYALMVCMAYLIILNMAWIEQKHFGARLSFVLLAIWLSLFIFILQSMTGIIIWLLCSYFLLLYTLGFVNKTRLKTVGYTILIFTPLMIGGYVFLQIDTFYPDNKPNFESLDKYTSGGEPYVHDTNSLNLENGNFINFYIAYHELEVEWNKRSNIPFWEGLDKTNQPINATLIRYLTSKGLRKDSVGVNSLTKEDISAVENGVANVRFLYGNPLDTRVYTVIWEFDRLMKEKNVQGHSVTQRLVFWKTGWQIFKNNPLIGVGTGDVNISFQEMYDKVGIKLQQPYRLRTHNQFLTFGISFGTIGLLIFLASVILPFIQLKNANSFLYIGFSIILYTSMINEDTLETQAGVTLYAFFNALLLFGYRNQSNSDNTSS
ncbi:MAG: O-antigen ligase family protein [Salibacteraceae bacterium]